MPLVVQYILIAYFRLNVLYLLISCPYIAPPCFPLSHWEPLVCSLHLWVCPCFVIYTFVVFFRFHVWVISYIFVFDIFFNKEGRKKEGKKERRQRKNRKRGKRKGN